MNSNSDFQTNFYQNEQGLILSLPYGISSISLSLAHLLPNVKSELLSFSVNRTGTVSAHRD